MSTDLFVPLLLLLITAVWGVWMKRTCRFRMPRIPFWPFAENPGLALELAGSAEFVSQVLGDPESETGRLNRRVASRLQKLDFGFIPLYTAFVIAAAVEIGTWPWLAPVIG